MMCAAVLPSSISLLNFFSSLSFFRIGITDSFIILPHFFSTVNTFSTVFLGLAILLSYAAKPLLLYVQYNNKIYHKNRRTV